MNFSFNGTELIHSKVSGSDSEGVYSNISISYSVSAKEL